jgi:cysteine desulfurase
LAVGLARAAELAVAERETEWDRLRVLRDILEAELLSRVPDAIVNGADARRVPHIVNIAFPGADREALLMALDLAGIACSSGSACQSGTISPSHVLIALGLPADLTNAAIRLSLGALTTPDDIIHVTQRLPALVEKARSMSANRA